MVAREDAAAVVSGIGRASFRPNSRWLATIAGIPVDRVNIAIHSLLCAARLRMPSTQQWQLTQPGEQKHGRSRHAVANRFEPAG